jgi:hypothetical protein
MQWIAAVTKRWKVTDRARSLTRKQLHEKKAVDTSKRPVVCLTFMHSLCNLRRRTATETVASVKVAISPTPN